MEKKLMIADFAALVGTTSKTIYQKISKSEELPVNERLITVKEKVKGREVTLIITNSDQINFYKNIYGNNLVNNSEYYETLAENNGYKPVENVNSVAETFQEPVNPHHLWNSERDIFEEFVTVNNQFNERYEQKITELITVHKELAEVKERQLLLEDKAGREGLYINEINELKKDNNRQRILIYLLITVIVFLIFGLIGYLTYNITVNNLHDSVNNVSETVINEKKPAAVQAPQPAKNASNQHKK